RQNEDRLWVDSYIIADNGRFTTGTSEAFEWNNDVLVSYNTEITSDFDLSLNVGANSRKERGTSVSANTGDALIVPNFFSIGNTSDNRAGYSFGQPRNVNSVYGFAQLGFKDAIYVDLTARNDWSSTLPSDNWSFFYPSVGVNVVLSDLTTLPDFVTFAKVRASWAEVGNDTRPFQTLRTARVGAGGANGFLTVSGTIPNEDLLPESTKSIEVGADLRFMQNRIGLDFTYYKSNSENQLFSVALPVGSGASQFFTNGGDVENKGIEAILSFTPVRTDDFEWNVGFNYTRNRSTVVAINDERPRIQVGSDFLRAFFIEQGEPWGNVFSRGFVRDAQDRIIVDSDGVPMITGGRTVLAANYNPDWLGGITNNLNYKGVNVSFLIDIRSGGSVTSMTNAIVYGGGHTQETVAGRSNLIFGQGEYAKWGEAVKEDGSPNDIATTAEAFWNKVGGRNAPAGEAFAVDASNVRLRELVVGYELPIESSSIDRLRVSLVGRNLFFISNKAGDIDPEILTNTGKAAEGFNSFAPPTMRSFGVNLQADF
ncbi:MAG: TonB-dependent receptor, partial [Saprospiraceae bacterium]|nr:TonB-dependent receptor [Saprospiraceae bacterium]